jgi:hypothetical protein
VNISIVIAVNKKDVWFCRICVASIRYYYPNVTIFLLKDELNGKFSTKEIERYWNVQLINYQTKKFGWSASKVHFYCDASYKGERFLVLDSDIVFVGKLLDQSFVQDFSEDVIVSDQILKDPNSEWFSKTYFDYKLVKDYDNRYEFPGFAFNCGQLFCKGGFLDRKDIEPFFDFNRVPAWKMLSLFPLVDQSVFNFLLPILSNDGKLNIGRESYMLWSETNIVRNLKLENIKIGNDYPYLLHWAGALRMPLLSKMTAGKILIFFEDYYYSRVQFGFIKKIIRKFSSAIKYYPKNFILFLKKVSI